MSIAAEIVLTGGPCAGKSTAFSYIEQVVSGWGFRVLFASEVATFFINGGVSNVLELKEKEDDRQYWAFQNLVMKQQRNQRDVWRRIAEEVYPDEECLLVFDRGEKDGEAYCTPDQFERILHNQGLTTEDISDSYDAVIHLVTAADGALEAFKASLSNNPARLEQTPEEAILLDKAVQNAWVGHPHLRVVDNSTSFELKLKRVVQHIARVLGEPEPLEIEKKFLLASVPDFHSDDWEQARAIEIEQTYLLSSADEEVRVRRRVNEGHATHYFTKKSPIRPGVRTETERRISEREYTTLLELRDPERKTVRKTRWCFEYGRQYFEVDIIREPLTRTCALLEIELATEDEEVRLPHFLDVDREVTNDPVYSNADLAKG